MVLEREEQIQEKRLDSEINLPEDEDQFVPSNKMHNFDEDFNDNKKTFPPSHKKKIQLTFDDVLIKTIPKVKKCFKGKDYQPLKERVILNHVSGTILPGQFLAIIGASGAGKTTLLNYLSGREISQNLNKKGKIYVNGVDRDQIKGFAAFSAYVQQDDILFQTMTVRECLEFAAKLKLKGSYESKIKRVDEIITELRLNKCQNTKIGGPLVKGVSGGERKRTSIGVELITDPTLIFLDEPTTGLDSFTATSVMETLKELAMSGRTIISTIHQPNSDIFQNFDRLMLLAQGKIIFYNEARLSVDYFASIDFKCPELSNPADYFMSIMSIESIEQEETEEQTENQLSPQEIQEKYAKRINYFDDCYNNSKLKNDHKQMYDGLEPLTVTDRQLEQVGWFYQLGLLLKRNFLNTVRLPQTSYVKLIVTVITAVFAIILFYDVDGTLQGVQNRNGSLFFIVMTIAFNAIQNTILIFPDERPVFLREVNNNMYSVSGYFFAKILADLPVAILTPVIFGCIVYYAIGYSTVYTYSFPIFLGILILIYCAGGSYALIISSIFSDKQLAVTLTPVLIIPFMLFAGFFVNQNNIPVWLIQFQYLSFFKYGYQAVMLNEYDGLELECMKEVGPRRCDPLGDFDSPETLGESVGALAGLYGGCYIVSLLIMKRLSRKYD